MTRQARRPAVHGPRLLSAIHAAELLDCSDQHVYNLIARGQLRAVQIATKGSKRPKTRVRVEDLEAFIDAHTRQGGAA